MTVDVIDWVVRNALFFGTLILTLRKVNIRLETRYISRTFTRKDGSRIVDRTKIRDRAGKKPEILVTDGLRSYHDAWLKEFRTNKQADSTVHIRNITLAGNHNNNKMERLNEEIRDREKVTRNLKKDDMPILTGMQIFHTYIRPHMGLNGKTPAELAGIKVEGKDKWLTLIQNAKAKHDGQ